VIITISREYGAAGRAVTHALAELLGYRVLDEELPEVRATGFAQRLLRSLSAAIPEALAPHADVDELALSVQREIERHMREAAEGDDVIVVGRLGNFVLRERPNVLRVFLIAALPWRIAHIAESLGCTPAVARAEIARVDNGRRNSARERYDFAWGDPHEYDLVVDVGRLGVAGAVAVIDAARRARE
jgi:cytidylate kinase